MSYPKLQGLRVRALNLKHAKLYNPETLESPRAAKSIPLSKHPRPTLKPATPCKAIELKRGMRL